MKPEVACAPADAHSDPLMASWPAMPLAVVVGAGGMGAAVARRLAGQHRLLLADLNSERLRAVVSSLKDEGAWVESVVCDVTRSDSVQGVADRAAQLGPLRALVQVAGLSPSMADWETILKVNLVGPTLMTNALLPLAAAGSCAILIASLAAHLAGKPSREVLRVLDEPLRPDFPAALTEALGRQPSSIDSYQLSKLALIRLCRRRAGAWGARRARIVSLSPGLIATPMGALEYRNPAKYELLTRTPLQRQGGLSEIADAVEFLASDRASFISGVDLLVDGGVSAAIEFQT
jgi:NAD(P)-dependent dehydrogenase (short-subunit alcohol dehydrogenase family)